MLLSFENNKKLLLGSSISVHGIYPLSNESFSLAQLDFERGGLGYQNSILTQRAAIIASFVDTREELLKFIPNLNDLLSNPLPNHTTFNDYKNAVHSITTEIDNTFNPSDLTYIRGCTTQYQISIKIKDHEQQEYINNIHDPQQLAFYHSCCQDKCSKLSFNLFLMVNMIH